MDQLFLEQTAAYSCAPTFYIHNGVIKNKYYIHDAYFKGDGNVKEFKYSNHIQKTYWLINLRYMDV